MQEKEKTNQEEHYICLGGCRGVSKVPGICQAPNCENHNHELVRCYCTDGLHNDFKIKKD
jgi:hypothetical protein